MALQLLGYTAGVERRAPGKQKVECRAEAVDIAPEVSPPENRLPAPAI